MESTTFAGHDCVLLENRALRLLVTRSVGPRILSFGFREGENLFALLPGFVTECPGVGLFHFRGGHRLWESPESPSRTYLPDDSPVEITPLEVGLRVVQPTQPRTGLQKSLEIRLEGDSARVEVLHRLNNHGAEAATLAPWAITQLRPGGTAILPQSLADSGVLPNRTLAMWAYTDPADPHVKIGRSCILVKSPLDAAFKLGFPNPRGWLAYWLDGTLFVKRARYEAGAEYIDFGSSSECYANDRFLELETLGPLQTLAPGDCAEHVETWELFVDVKCPQDEGQAHALAERLGLG